MDSAFPIADNRVQTLCFMAGLLVSVGELCSAEGYLLEIVAWVAFGDRVRTDMKEDNV